MKHKEWELLSAFLDGELVVRDRIEVESHLASCADCSQELHVLESIKKLAALAPRHPLPLEIVAKLEKDIYKPTWVERVSKLLRTPQIFVPVGAAFVLVVGLVLWKSVTEGTEIPLEPLIAAHTRYSAEGLLYQEDLAHPELVAYASIDHEE